VQTELQRRDKGGLGLTPLQRLEEAEADGRRAAPAPASAPAPGGKRLMFPRSKKAEI
jgi:hypothetical protein